MNSNTKNILETINMLDNENLDIRTVTLGINLMDCIDSDEEKCLEKIYKKITTTARDLVKISDEIGNKYGIPVVHKRIAVTPISLIAGATNAKSYVPFAKVLDRAAKDVGVNFIGGFSAIIDKNFTDADRILINSIPEALSTTDVVCSSVNIGSTKNGINMEGVKLMGEIIKKSADLTKDRDSIGCAKLVVFCNSVSDNPFMAGAYHGICEAESSISIGISGPGAVKSAIEKLEDVSIDKLCNEIKRISFKITRMGELVGREVAKKMQLPFNIVDLSLAPTPAIGDSIARIIQLMGIERCGGHGTTAALALLNDSVKKGGIMASTNVGGLSGAFIPVSEDEGMIESAQKEYITFDKLEAMTCVCSVGLDMIAIPGDTPASTISAIIADEAAIGMVNSKTTAVRVIPVIGKKEGDMVNFGGLLGYAPIMKISKLSSEKFIKRGGFIPAPIHSFKN